MATWALALRKGLDEVGGKGTHERGNGGGELPSGLLEARRDPPRAVEANEPSKRGAEAQRPEIREVSWLVERTNLRRARCWVGEKEGGGGRADPIVRSKGNKRASGVTGVQGSP